MPLLRLKTGNNGRLFISIFIVLVVLAATYGLIRYDRVIRYRLDHVDPVLAQALAEMPEGVQVPVLISVEKNQERVLDQYGIEPINPYTHREKGYNAVYSMRLDIDGITSLQGIRGVEAVQFDSEATAIDIVSIAYKPDEFHDFDEFRRQNIDGEGIIVAKLDSGATPKMSYVGVYSSFGDDGIDRHGHGTSTEEVLRRGCPKCGVVSFKVLDNNNAGTSTSIIKGLDKVAELRDSGVPIRVLYGSISSRGGGAGSVLSMFANRLAVDYGIVSFYASGNHAQPSIGGPGNSRYVWDVRALQPLGGSLILAGYSNYGEKNSRLSISDLGNWKTVMGTSYSTPRAAAKTALILSYYKKKGVQLSSSQVNNLIANSALAQDFGSPGYDPRYGLGMLTSSALLSNDYKSPIISLQLSSPAYQVMPFVWIVGIILIGIINKPVFNRSRHRNLFIRGGKKRGRI